MAGDTTKLKVAAVVVVALIVVAILYFAHAYVSHVVAYILVAACTALAIRLIYKGKKAAESAGAVEETELKAQVYTEATSGLARELLEVKRREQEGFEKSAEKDLEISKLRVELAKCGWPMCLNKSKFKMIRSKPHQNSN